MVQSCPQAMRIQRRLYGIYTVYFLIFIVSWDSKLVCFFAKSKDLIQPWYCPIPVFMFNALFNS